jgi:hypothetical protein
MERRCVSSAFSLSNSFTAITTRNGLSVTATGAMRAESTSSTKWFLASAEQNVRMTNSAPGMSFSQDRQTRNPEQCTDRRAPPNLRPTGCRPSKIALMMSEESSVSRST